MKTTENKLTAPEAMGMKWYKFLIYFGLYASAVLNAIAAIGIFLTVQLKGLLPGRGATAFWDYGVLNMSSADANAALGSAGKPVVNWDSIVELMQSNFKAVRHTASKGTLWTTYGFGFVDMCLVIVCVSYVFLWLITRNSLRRYEAKGSKLLIVFGLLQTCLFELYYFLLFHYQVDASVALQVSTYMAIALVGICVAAFHYFYFKKRKDLFI